MQEFDQPDLMPRIRRDVADDFDEALGLALEDSDVDTDSLLPAALYGDTDSDAHRRYFRELFRMQAELVKLQDWIVHTKKRARLNCIHHLLQQMPYVEIRRESIQLPEREYHEDYVRRPVPPEIVVPEIY